MHSVLVHAVSLSTHLCQVRIGKVSGSAGGSNATESWLPSRGVGFMDERTERFKILMVEFAAASDMKRRMPLGFWLLVGVLHTVSSFSFVESVSCLCCARGGQSVIDVVEVLAVVCANEISQPLLCARGRQSQSSVQSVSLCCALGGGSRNRLCVLGEVRGREGSRQGEGAVEDPT